MCQSRSGGVFGGLWQTLYVSGDDETSPIGWGGAWDRVDKLGSGLEHHAAVRGGRFRDLQQWMRGRMREIGLLEATGME